MTDGFCIYRITNAKTQKVSITFTKEKSTETKVYDLTGLTLDTEGS